VHQLESAKNEIHLETGDRPDQKNHTQTLGAEGRKRGNKGTEPQKSSSRQYEEIAGPMFAAGKEPLAVRAHTKAGVVTSKGRTTECSWDARFEQRGAGEDSLVNGKGGVTVVPKRPWL